MGSNYNKEPSEVSGDSVFCLVPGLSLTMRTVKNIHVSSSGMHLQLRPYLIGFWSFSLFVDKLL